MLNLKLETIAFIINEIRAFEGQIIMDGDKLDLIENAERFVIMHDANSTEFYGEEVEQLIAMHNVPLYAIQKRVEEDAKVEAIAVEAIQKGIKAVPRFVERGLTLDKAIRCGVVEAIGITNYNLRWASMTKAQAMKVAAQVVDAFTVETVCTNPATGKSYYIDAWLQIDKWIHENCKG